LRSSPAQPSSHKSDGRKLTIASAEAHHTIQVARAAAFSHALDAEVPPAILALFFDQLVQTLLVDRTIFVPEFFAFGAAASHHWVHLFIWLCGVAIYELA
jgi:hypothetical protein